LYQWLVFLHLLGVFGFLISHGVSVAVTFALRKERDPARVQSLLRMSSSSISFFYPSLLLLLGGGIAATFAGHLWGYGWIWASIGLLVLLMAAMYAGARPYYRRLRFVTEALVGGSKAVPPDQYEAALTSGRGVAVAVIGFAGLVVILYLMLFKPTLGMSPDAAPAAVTSGDSWAEVTISASELAFSATELAAPAGRAFKLVLENKSAVPHNLSIYDERGRAAFRGEIFAGPKSVVYRVPALQAGAYKFVCDVHPLMTGKLRAG
jgi:plastocyanin/uncharacterized membrane protein